MKVGHARASYVELCGLRLRSHHGCARDLTNERVSHDKTFILHISPRVSKVGLAEIKKIGGLRTRRCATGPLRRGRTPRNWSFGMTRGCSVISALRQNPARRDFAAKDY
jgi:hypothetical protein